MSGSKIHLSKDELDLVKNSSWILTKNLVMEKFMDGLGDLSRSMTEKVGSMDLYFEGSLKNPGPRISRGERYEGLPWLVLDYPRIFGKEDIFAIRTFFWWGRHCSISIHCRGKFMPDLSRGILANSNKFIEGNYFLSTQGDEWVHNLEALPFQPLKFRSKEDMPEHLDQSEFIRLGCVTPLNQWSIMEKQLFKGFTELIETMRSG